MSRRNSLPWMNSGTHSRTRTPRVRLRRTTAYTRPAMNDGRCTMDENENLPATTLAPASAWLGRRAHSPPHRGSSAHCSTLTAHSLTEITNREMVYPDGCAPAVGVVRTRRALLTVMMRRVTTVPASCIRIRAPTPRIGISMELRQRHARLVDRKEVTARTTRRSPKSLVRHITVAPETVITLRIK